MRDLDGRLPAKALIKDRNYSHWWTVKVKTTGEENHYSFMRSGWRKLVRDCELKETDFLVFTLISNSVFEIVRYAPNGCEKELISNPIIELQDPEQIKENPAEAPKTRSQKSKETETLPRNLSLSLYLSLGTICLLVTSLKTIGPFRGYNWKHFSFSGFFFLLPIS
ncbi:hypothetical protein RHMOL_Rhmol08G0126700 [Rhododendron molle]|nr:hypothetical protein RHMOL_Rhmol08G0126700 [Rhododendron molle]